MKDARFYEWWGDLDAIHIRFPARHFENWWMVEGRPVVGWRQDLLATYSSDDVASSNFGLARNSWPVFSPVMRTFLENLVPGLIQFLPFRLTTPDGSAELTGYSVGQFLRLVDCLDRNKTITRDNWKPINESGDFGVLRPIVIDRTLIGEDRLFRLIGMCHLIVIREDLKDAIEKAGFPEQRFDLIAVSESQ